MIRTSHLRVDFGSVEALAGVDLTVNGGEVRALLGPNGAGKTTLVRVISTLLTPTAGTATVDGVDVVDDPMTVRRSIGLTGQHAAVDDLLTGRENLEIVGRLYQLPKAEAERPRRRGPGATVAQRPRRPSGPDLLGWDAAASRPRSQPRRAPQGAHPRRAHHRARPPRPDRALGTSSGSSCTAARRCFSPPSTSTRPTSWPTA